MYLKVLLIVISILQSFAVNADINNFRLKTLDIDSGLPHNTVQYVTQTQNGYIWLGTSMGLSRFDGYEFKNFNTLNSNISHPSVTSIVEDAKGNLWVGTQKGLNYFNVQTNIFTQYINSPTDPNSISHNNIWRIMLDKENRLWVATMGGGLNLYLGNSKFKHFSTNGDKSTQISSNFVSDIAQDQIGNLWVSTHNGLNYVDLSLNSISVFSNSSDGNAKLDNDAIWSMYLLKNKLLLGTTKGLVVYDIVQKTFENIKISTEHSINQTEIISIASLDDESIWLGTKGDGLFQLNLTNSELVELKRTESKYSLADNSIRHLFFDTQNNLWISTNGSGVSLLSPYLNIFSHVKKQLYSGLSLNSDIVISTFEKSSGDMLIGTAVGLHLYRKELNDISPINELSNFQIWDIKHYLGDKYWLATDNGLLLFNHLNGTYKKYSFSNNSENTITDILPENSELLWLGTSQGLYLFDIRKEIFELKSKESYGLARDLVFDENQDIWMRNEQGLAIYSTTNNEFIDKKKTLNRLGLEIPLKHNIQDIYIDSRDYVWVGTYGNGLVKINTKEGIATVFNSENILLNDNVYSIVEDSNKNIWLGSEQGLTKIYVKDSSVEHFDYRDGLPSIQFVIGKAYKKSNGNLLFPFTNGYTEFNPTLLDSKPNSLALFLTDIFVDNEPLFDNQIITSDKLSESNNNFKTNLEIDYVTRSVRFEFAGLNYTTPHSQQYHYKLEGYDKKWFNVGSKNRTASYGKLPSGKYTFLVKLTNESANTASQQLSLAVVVNPAPWNTWWAYLIYLLLFCFIVIKYHQSQVNKLKSSELQNIQLEKRILERTKELSSANEKLVELTLTDQLTGLSNRRFLQNYIENDLKLIQRAKEAESLVFFIVDIDHFKQINDNFGHSIGDKVLVNFAEVIKSVFRTTDYKIRWGGEEFLVVSRFIPNTEAKTLSERLRATVEAFNFNYENEVKLNVTCSIGFSYYPKTALHKYTWENVVHLADHCLYAAKNSSRNAWVGFEFISDSFDISNANEESIKNALTSGNLSVCSSFIKENIIKW